MPCQEYTDNCGASWAAGDNSSESLFAVKLCLVPNPARADQV